MAAYHTYFYGGKHDFGDALQRVVDAENEVLNIDGIPRSARGHAVVNAAAEANVIIVTGGQDNGIFYCTRTPAAMIAVAKGAWLLDETWITTSLQFGTASFSDYEIHDVRADRKHPSSSLALGGPKKAREVRPHATDLRPWLYCNSLTPLRAVPRTWLWWSVCWVHSARGRFWSPCTTRRRNPRDS